MKAESQLLKFKPVKITFTLETKDELEMVQELFGKNITIPALFPPKMKELCSEFFNIINKEINTL